jgi:hypothetical protein
VTAVERLKRLEGQLAALVLMGQDIRPVLAEVAELRCQLLQRPDPVQVRAARTRQNDRQRFFNRRYRARLAKLAASR